MKSLLLLALLCCLAFAVSATTVKWCVISDHEMKTCGEVAKSTPLLCVRRENPHQCIVAIKAGEADAIILSGVDIYKAGLRNYNLVPIVAVGYDSAATDACFYSVAVAKKNTAFGLKDLRGKKTCHTGLGDDEGWTLPIGTLLTEGVIDWAGTDSKPLLEAVAEFFSASCVPGATGHPTLCQLCKGDCSKSSSNLYYGDDGAFKCLVEDAGQVAFVKPNAIPDSEKNNYELLCKDNSRAPIDNYKTCNLGKVPAHAVVSRNDKQLAEVIWTGLQTAGVNCIKTKKQVPPDTDSFLYLGVDYVNKIYSLNKDQTRSPSSTGIKWCAVGHDEKTKCDNWNGNSFNQESGSSAIECQSASTVEECFKKIMRQEADAVAVDGGQVYTAGKCGLVPVMVEQYNEGMCGNHGASASSYYSVAVVKKGSGVTWANLKGKRSCHTGIGRTAGWNIPMGLIHKETNHCDFTKFFTSGCAPGADLTSPFCRQCIGSGKAVGDESKCKASADERYYGYAGAFRCLAEGAGDVAFIKHTIVGENTNGNGPDWASSLRSEEFELICPGKDRMPIGDYESCNLAVVPAHAVMTRPEISKEVVDILQDQQAKFGRNGSDDKFRMFQSENGKNLLFKDSTKCLQKVQADTFETFLGPNYMAAMQSLRQCSGTAPDVEKSCTFQTCQ